MWRYIASLTVVLLVTPFAFGATKNVLILHEGSRQLPYQYLLSSELQKDLGKTPFDIQIFDEYLDAARLKQDPSYAAEWIKAKYAGKKIDVVVVDGNVPFQVMLHQPPAFLRGTPVVFLTVPDFDLPSPMPPNITGVAIHKEFGATVRLAMRLQPGLQHLFYVESGLLPNALRNAAVQEDLAPFENQLDVVDLSGLSVDDLLARVKSLPPHSAILFDTYVQDPFGRSYVPAEVSDLIGTTANAPVYALYQTVMGKGAAGGVVISFEAVGEQGARIVRGLLAGAPVSHYPVVHSHDATMVDWGKMQRFGIPESNLPPSAIILFRPPTVWEKYRGYIIAAVIVILLQTALIIELALAGKLRKRSERSARELASRLINAQEVERRRLAGELHDDVSQRLALIAIQLDSLRQSPPATRADLTRELTVLYDETDCISSDIHRYSHELHPAVLEGLGLSMALRRYCVEVSEHRKIAVHMFTNGEEPRISSEIALAFFRIGQECLTNVAKHSGATECKVSLTYTRDRIRLVVQDDGHGFKPDDEHNRMGLGIQSMRERLRSIGGSLSIKSSLQRGTSVIAEAPITTEAPLHSPGIVHEGRPEGSTASTN